MKIRLTENRLRRLICEAIEEAWSGIEDIVDSGDLTRAALKRGFRYIAFHNTNNKNLTFFDVRSSGIHFGSEKAANERGEDRGDIDSYTGQYFLKIDKPYIIERDFDWERTGACQACGDDDDYEEWRKEYEAEYYLEQQGFKYVERDKNGDITNFNTIEQMLAQKGYDSIVYKNDVEDKGSYSVAMFKPNNIKLACITYDDNGKEIPLEKRFDTSTVDVRY